MLEKKEINIPVRRVVLIMLQAAVIFSVFLFYSSYRQKYVGACDWYGYYSQSLLLKEGRLPLQTELNPHKYPAVAPLGFYTKEGQVVPHFPPGYPLLMALLGTVGLEFHVTPILGTLSFILLFLVLSRLTDRWIALLLSVLWALSPIVIWGSTSVMSDMGACVFILLTFYLFLKRRPEAAGLTFGFSLLIRPSNIIFAAVLLPLIAKEKKLVPFGLFFFIPTSISAIYNWGVHGSPWKYGYYDTLSLLSGSIFPENALFYTGQVLMQFTPLLLLIAIIPLWKKQRGAWVYSLWFLCFFFFYSFINLGRESWWSLRFLLPAYPALFILAALGAKNIRDYVSHRWRCATSLAVPVMVILTVVISIYFIRFEAETLLFTRDKAKVFHDTAHKVAARVPPGSVVGAFEMSGPLRLYGGIESFNLNHPRAVKLIRRMLRERPVYVMMEPLLRDSHFFKKRFRRFLYEEIEMGSDQKEYCLYRIIRRRLKEKKFVLPLDTQLSFKPDRDTPRERPAK